MAVGGEIMFENVPLPEEKREAVAWWQKIRVYTMPYTEGSSWWIGKWGKVDAREKAIFDRTGQPYFGCSEEVTEDEAMAFFDDRKLPRPIRDGRYYPPDQYIPLREEEEDEPWRSDFFGELTPAQAREIWEKMDLEWQGDDWAMPDWH